MTFSRWFLNIGKHGTRVCALNLTRLALGIGRMAGKLDHPGPPQHVQKSTFRPSGQTVHLCYAHNRTTDRYWCQVPNRVKHNRSIANFCWQPSSAWTLSMSDASRRMPLELRDTIAGATSCIPNARILRVWLPGLKLKISSWLMEHVVTWSGFGTPDSGAFAYYSGSCGPRVDFLDDPSRTM